MSLDRAIIEWYRSVAEWIPAHLGDPELSDEIRADLGMRPGPPLSASENARFHELAAGLDADRAALSETIAEVSEIVQELRTLAATLATSASEPSIVFQAYYTLLKMGATDSVRVRSPPLYAILRAILFLGEDSEQVFALDPARLLRGLRGADLPDSEWVTELVSFVVGLTAQLLDATLFDKQANDEDPGFADVFYGWDSATGSLTPKADSASMRATTVVFGDAKDTNKRVTATIVIVPPQHGGPGLFISGGGGYTTQGTIGGAPYRFDAGLGNGFDLYHPLAIGLVKFNVGDSTPFVKFRVVRGDASTPAFRIGDAGSTRLDVGFVELGVDLSEQGAALRAGVRDAELVIGGGDGDGFVRRLVAATGLRVRFSANLVADTDGLRLEGGSKLNTAETGSTADPALPAATEVRAVMPAVRASSGMLTIHEVDLALRPSSSGGDLGVLLSGDFSVKLGPFAATVEGMGFQLDADQRLDGNLGPIHIEPSFKAPDGIGLRLDAGVVRGGGFLRADHERGEYAGALELTFGKISVKAIGLLAERPGGWSLVLVLYARFPPIELAFGFTLNSVGGLIGLQHGIDIPQLAAGMRTGAFDDILFPADPVADAPRIIQRLRVVFPYTPGALTIGPMVELGYGRPRQFAFVRMAILLQLDNALGSGSVAFARIVLAGNLRIAISPTEDDPDTTVVRLIVDFLGFWDWDRKRYGFLGRLRDSRIGPVDVTGSVGVWGEYGEHPRFLLAAGGFNPRFKDVPAEMSGSMDRLGAGFSIGRFEIALKGYFALTPGTIQAGVDLAVKGTVGPVGIRGAIGFDALVYLEPYTHFIVDFRVTAEISYKGHSLAGVKVSGTIEGPGRWHLVGKVSFSILWWDISKSFDESWGTTPQIATVATDVSALLRAELASPANWSAQLPQGSEAIVTLAPADGAPQTLAHPLGRCVFSQNVAPFGLTLERFGSGPVSGPNRFDVLPVAGQEPVREHFARAQFVEMSEEDKLTRPSFEQLDAGVQFSSGAFHVPADALAADMDFEATAYLDLDPRRHNRTRRDPSLRKVAVDHAILGVLAARGAAGRTPLRMQERMEMRREARIAVSAPPLASADRDTFAGAAFDGQARVAEMLADQRLAAGAQLVEVFELEGS